MPLKMLKQQPALFGLANVLFLMTSHELSLHGIFLTMPRLYSEIHLQEPDQWKYATSLFHACSN